MKLRNLMPKDVEYMLEWMHDDKINKFFRFDASGRTKENTLDYILSSQNLKNDHHFAIANDNDEYLGTVSLKNVDLESKNAEYAIALRANAQGTGAGSFATEAICEFAFKNLDLHRVYLNVFSDNFRAIRFYEKSGFIFEGEFYQHIFCNNKWHSLKWYRIMKEEFYERYKDI